MFWALMKKINNKFALSLQRYCLILIAISTYACTIIVTRNSHWLINVFISIVMSNVTKSHKMQLKHINNCSETILSINRFLKLYKGHPSRFIKTGTMNTLTRHCSKPADINYPLATEILQYLKLQALSARFFGAKVHKPWMEAQSIKPYATLIRSQCGKARLVNLA